MTMFKLSFGNIFAVLKTTVLYYRIKLNNRLQQFRLLLIIQL